MAKGNSVQEQQPATNTFLTDQEKERSFRARALQACEVQSVELSCARVREQLQRSQNARYSELLERELHHLETQLSRMQ
jgi:hypothetical protein